MNIYLADRINNKSININILRFICAIAVIICHSYAITIGEEDFFNRYTNGQCNLGGVAVAVFFFLSGLYVSKSLDRSGSVLSYLRKRCQRIFPQLWIVVICSIVMGAMISVYPISQYIKNKETYKYLLNGLLVPVHNLPGVFEGMPYSTVNGSLWTLPIEFFCYVGVAVCSLFSIHVLNNRKKLIFILTLTAFLATFIFIWIKMPDTMLLSIVRPMLLFFEGVLYYEYKDRIRLNPVIAGLTFIICILMGLTPFFNIGLILLFPYSFLCLALGLPQFKHNIRIFSISYEMYLVGWPIQQLIMMHAGRMSPLSNCLITLPVDIVIGWIVSVTTERIMKKMR